MGGTPKTHNFFSRLFVKSLSCLLDSILSLESTLFRDDSPAVCFNSRLRSSRVVFKFRKSAENWPSNNVIISIEVFVKMPSTRL